jgi:hypothetical protein
MVGNVMLPLKRSGSTYFSYWNNRIYALVQNRYIFESDFPMDDQKLIYNFDGLDIDRLFCFQQRRLVAQRNISSCSEFVWYFNDNHILFENGCKRCWYTRDKVIVMLYERKISLFKKLLSSKINGYVLSSYAQKQPAIVFIFLMSYTEL